jgi:hypothetical protein
MTMVSEQALHALCRRICAQGSSGLLKAHAEEYTACECRPDRQLVYFQASPPSERSFAESRVLAHINEMIALLQRNPDPLHQAVLLRAV